LGDNGDDAVGTFLRIGFEADGDVEYFVFAADEYVFDGDSAKHPDGHFFVPASDAEPAGRIAANGFESNGLTECTF